MTFTIGVGTEKGGYLLRTNDRRSFSVTGPLFAGWKVNAFGRAFDGTFLAGVGSSWFGAAVHRSKNLENWEQVVESPRWPEGSDRKLNHIWTFHLAGQRLYAGVDEAGLFASDDYGLTWQPVDALNEHPSRKSWFPGAGGMCAHRILSDRDRLWVGISAVGVFRSDDVGATFERKDDGVPPTVDPGTEGVDEAGWCVHNLSADPANPDRIWRQDHRGVFRTNDGGDRWERIENGLPAGFGFVMARDRASGRLFTVPLEADTNRLPVAGRLAAYQSDDDGDSWHVSGTGWPAAETFTGVLRGAVDTDDRGGLAFGTTAGKVWTTFDAGDTWSELPFTFPRVNAMAVLES
jgi:hypothetical protein